METRDIGAIDSGYLGAIVNRVVISKACSIKPDADSTESKVITLKATFNGVTLNDVFAKAVSQAVIQWQNGPGRRNFDTYANNQTIDIDFKAPGRTTIDPEVAMIAKLSAMTPEDAEAEIKRLMAKAGK